MVMGYPGRTSRYITSWETQETIDNTNAVRVKVRTKKLSLMKEDMDKSLKVRIQYASKYAESANYWKYSIGQNRGLKNLDVIAKKKAIEKKLTDWMNLDNTRKLKYGESFSLIEKAIASRKTFNATQNYLYEALIEGCEITTFVLQCRGLEELLNDKTKKDALKAKLDELKSAAEKFYKDYYPETDKKIMSAMLKMYYESVSKDFYPPFYKDFGINYQKDIDKYVEKMFAKSIFADSIKFYAFLKNPDAKTFSKDLTVKTSADIISVFRNIRVQGAAFDNSLQKGDRLFITALMEMESDKTFYPDANSTMRLTYGVVDGYEPADGVIYKYYTTLKGYIEKEDSTNAEFIVPKKLKELYYKKDFGQYAENGEIITCFTTNNDITGGNSGSPVINAKGQLIGAAFDGNWEAMSGDIAYEPAIQKCICADIRFILFIIDKISGATNLINEMTIVKGEAPSPAKMLEQPVH